MNRTLKLLPLLVLYVAVVLLFAQTDLRGDEGRYVMFARNITRGHYSPRDTVNLWHGPGYPIVLAPFVGFGVPLLVPKLLNAVFLFLAVLCFARTVRLHAGEGATLCAAYLFGLYWPFLRTAPLLYSEPLSVLLACGFIYHVCRLDGGEGVGFWPHGVVAGLFAGYLALTKVIFGYVLAVCLASFCLAYLIRRSRSARRAAAAMGLGLALCLPYLAYTYSLTGRPFYWSNAGGAQLYWMSSPHPGEYGDWKAANTLAGLRRAGPQVYGRHMQFWRTLEGLGPAERDLALRRRALRNIRQHPAKFAYNWLCNIGRLVFSYPYSYLRQGPETYFYLVPNMFLFVLSVVCLVPTVLRRQHYPNGVWVLLTFGAFAFAGSTLLSAGPRMFVPIVPFICLWIAYTLTNRLEIRLA